MNTGTWLLMSRDIATQLPHGKNDGSLEQNTCPVPMILISTKPSFPFPTYNDKPKQQNSLSDRGRGRGRGRGGRESDHAARDRYA